MKLNTCFVMVLLLGGINQSSQASLDLKKVAKVVWHGTAIYAGVMIGSECRLKLTRRNFINGVATGSLVYHGFIGLDKELKLVKKIQEFLN